jgi:hypothetical protein
MDSEQSGMRQEQVWRIGLLEYRKRNTFMGGDDNVSMCQIHLICMFVSQMSSNANQVSVKNISLHLSRKSVKCQLMPPCSPPSVLKMNSLSWVSRIEVFTTGGNFRKT